jgi:beta-glucosidase
LKKGETKRISFKISPRQLSLIDNKSKRVIESGWFTVSIGGGQPQFTQNTIGNKLNSIEGRFKVSNSVEINE